MLRGVTFRRRRTRSKDKQGELTNRVIAIMKPSRGSDMKVCHMMDQRSTMKRCIKWTKFDMGS
jgi:hypothetical protein